MKNKNQLKNLSAVGIFAALTAVLSPHAIPMPVGVPITLGVLAVIISGVLLPPKLALLSQVVYIMIGLVGLPVFSGYKAGFSVIFGPTGGYLITYPIMAFIISFGVWNFMDKGSFKKPVSYVMVIISMIIALLLCYGTGTLWLSIYNDISIVAAFSVAVVPYIPFDLVKIAVSAVFILPVRGRILRTANMEYAKD